MIRHIVLCRYRPDVPESERQAIRDGLAALVGRIEGLQRASFGSNVSPEGLARGFDDGFVMDMVDAAARDRYLADPAHKAAGARMVAALEGGREGLLVFDLDVAE